MKMLFSIIKTAECKAAARLIRELQFVKDKPVGKVYYTADNADGYLLSIYPRILIKRRMGQ